MLRDGDGLRLEFVRRYAEPPQEVWAALTDPERLARWFGTWSGDPATGTVHVTMTEDEGATPQEARIVECRPPARLGDAYPVPDCPPAAGTALCYT